MVSPAKVLVVCTGNLCRSPLGAALLDRAAVQAGLPLQVRSRGLSAALGYPTPPETLAAADALGLSLAAHRPVQVTGQDACWAEEALVMESWQVERMALLRSGLLVTGLGEGLSPPEIPDPYGRAFEVHLEVGRLLERVLREWLTRRFPGLLLL